MTDPARYLRLARVRSEIILERLPQLLRASRGPLTTSPAQGLSREQWAEKLAALGEALADAA